MMKYIGNKNLFLILISVLFQNAFATKKCNQAIDPKTGEVKIHDTNCFGTLSSIITNACEVFKTTLLDKDYEILCQKQSALKANSSQGWKQSLENLEKILEKVDDKVKKKKIGVEQGKLRQAYDDYFREYVEEAEPAKLKASRLTGSRISTTSTDMATYASIAVQTDLDLNTLDQQYDTIAQQLTEISQLSETIAALQKRIRELDRQHTDKDLSIGDLSMQVSLLNIEKDTLPNNLENKTKYYEKEIKTLESQISADKTRHSKEKEELLKKLNEFKDRYKEAQSNLSEQRQGKLQMTKQNLDLQQKLEELQAQYHKLQTSSNQKDKEHEASHQNLTQLKTELEKKNVELTRTVENLQSVMNHKDEELQSAHNRYAQLQSEYDQQQNVTKELRERVDQQTQENRTAKKDNEKLIRENRGLQSKNEIYFNQNQGLKDGVAQLMQIAEKEIQNNKKLKAEVAQLLDDIKNQKLKSEELQANIQNLQKEVAQYKDTIQALQKEITDLKAQLEKERQAWNEERKEVTQTLLQAVQTTSDVLGVGHEALNVALEQHTDLAKAANIVREKISELSQEIQHKSAELKTLDQNRAQEKALLTKEIEQLQNAKKTLEHEKAGLTQQERELKASNAKLQEEIIQKSAEHAEEMKRQIAQNADNQEKQALLQAELEATQDQVSALQASFKELSNAKNGAIEDLEKLRKKQKESQEKVAKYYLKIRSLGNKFAKEDKKKQELIEKLTQENKSYEKQSKLQKFDQLFPGIQYVQSPDTFSAYLNNIRFLFREILAGKKGEPQLYEAYQKLFNYMEQHADVSLLQELPPEIKDEIPTYLQNWDSDKFSELEKQASALMAQVKSANSLEGSLNVLWDKIQEAQSHEEMIRLMQKYYAMLKQYHPNPASRPEFSNFKNIYLREVASWLQDSILSQQAKETQRKVLFEEAPDELKKAALEYQNTLSQKNKTVLEFVERVKEGLKTQEPDEQNAAALYDYLLALSTAYNQLSQFNTPEVEAYKRDVLGQIKTRYQQLLKVVFKQEEVSQEQEDALRNLAVPAQFSKEKLKMFTLHEAVKELYSRLNHSPNKTTDQFTENMVILFQIYEKIANHLEWFDEGMPQKIAQELIDNYTTKIRLQVAAYDNQHIPEPVIMSSTSFEAGAPEVLRELAEQARQYMVDHNSRVDQVMGQNYQRMVQEYNTALQQREAEYNAVHQKILEEHHETMAHQAQSAARASVEKFLSSFVLNPDNPLAFAVSLQALRDAYFEMNHQPQYFSAQEVQEIREMFVSYYHKNFFEFISKYVDKPIPKEIYKHFQLDTSGWDNETASAIKKIQKEMAEYLKNHNTVVEQQNLAAMFNREAASLSSALNENLEGSSFAALTVTLQRLYNLIVLCSNHLGAFPKDLSAISYKKRAEQKFKEGYIIMLERAKDIYGKHASTMFKIDEQAIRHIAVPEALKPELQSYLNTFFQANSIQPIELEESVTADYAQNMQPIVEEKYDTKRHYLQTHGSKQLPINIDYGMEDENTSNPENGVPIILE